MASFTLQCQSWGVAAETTWPQKLEIFITLFRKCLPTHELERRGVSEVQRWSWRPDALVGPRTRFEADKFRLDVAGHGEQLPPLQAGHGQEKRSLEKMALRKHGWSEEKLGWTPARGCFENPVTGEEARSRVGVTEMPRRGQIRWQPWGEARITQMEMVLGTVDD